MPMLNPVGALIALAIIASITSTIYWMLHLPRDISTQMADEARQRAEKMTGDVLVVFSREIHSHVLMALAARMAKRVQAQLFAIYILEVPLTLPIDAELLQQEREALEMLTAATEIGRKAGLEIQTRIIRERNAGPAIIQAAKEENATIIVMGTYRENRYAGAPLGKAIEYVTTHTHTDVLIAVSSALDTERML